MEELNDLNLSPENLLSENEIENLFSEEAPKEEEKKEGQEPEQKKEEKNDITEEPDFGKEINTPESVGNEEKEDNASGKAPSKAENESSSIYSSFAEALLEEGAFLDVDEETVKNVKTAEDFKGLIEMQIKNGLDERQKRIDEALENNVEPSEIKNYENTISYLRGIKEEDITEESEKGEELRKKLIYQDYVNNGFSKERALRELKKSIDSGSDVEDAKEALQNNLEHFESEYKNILETAKKEKAEMEEQRKKQVEELKDSILNTDKFFDEMQVDKNIRQKAFDNLMKPVYKDKETGNMLTAIQKYERENKSDFLKNLAFIFTLTDGFKNLDGLVKDKVQKEKKKGFAELERVINSTSRNSDGSLRFATGVNSDDGFMNGKKFDFDV